MPIERVSRGFKDVSMSFQINPLNDDLIAIKNEAAISRAVRNIILTSPGEKPFAPDFGSNVNRLLFENMDDLSALSINDEIEDSIRKYEPRVFLNEVDVSPNYEENSYDVKISYQIIGADVLPQQLEFVLQATR
jgi:phage baseplate assembly protein W